MRKLHNLARKHSFYYISIDMNRVRLFLHSILLVVLSGIFYSCSVFEPIGDSLSLFYDNSVSYFNAYYNARQIFDEAENALMLAQRDAKAKAILSQKPPAAVPIPRDKFNAVIDKCSSILSFYPKSALVDDAILLIGKSYFHLQDYLKAERKFSELLAQYPNSSLVLESRLWFAKTLERLRKVDEAKTIAQQVAQDGVEEGERAIASEAYALLGLMAEQENDFNQSILHYAKALVYINDSYMRASTNAKVGDLFFSLKEYEKANTAFIEVYEEGVSDISLNYYGRIQAVRGYSALKRYDTALFLAEEILDDYRFALYHPMARLEYAAVLLASGFTDDAVSEYQFMDTTYARTEHGARASFALAQYHEKQQGDYQRAASYYVRASAVQTFTSFSEARKRENALLRLVSYYRDLVKNDSLVVLSDSAKKYPEQFLQLVLPDTASMAADSTEESSDSLVVTPPAEPKYIATFTPLNPDSMRTVRARIAYDLAEIYYTEMEIADSALVWFERAWEWKIDSTRAPRTLFILAELKKALKNASPEDIAQTYHTILNEYSWSSYANEVRRILGIEIAVRTTEEDDEAYAVAESLLWSGDYSSAIEHLKVIVGAIPPSTLAAKSQYTLGWIYEHQLHIPDSALMYYRAVAEQHKTSPYASAVKNKIAGAVEEQKQEKPAQPAKPEQPPTESEQNLKITPPAVDDDIRVRRLPQGRGARPDTVKTRIDR